MARIRTIKPMFWEDELVGSLSPVTRLTFIGLFSLADDEGRLPGSAIGIRSRVFAYDEEVTTSDVHDALYHLHECRRIRLYGNPEQTFIEVLNFKKHQRIDRPQKSLLPAPGPHYPTLHRDSDNKQDFRGSLDTPSLDVLPRKGLEGKGLEEETPSSAASTDPVKPTVARQ